MGGKKSSMNIAPYEQVRVKGSKLWRRKVSHIPPLRTTSLLTPVSETKLRITLLEGFKFLLGREHQRGERVLRHV